MEEKILLRSYSDNSVDELVDQLIENMPYADTNILYPDINKCKIDDGVSPELFIEAYSGLKNDSERSAINQYMAQSRMYPKLSQTLMGIGLVEMKHMDHLGNLIKNLGGKIDIKWNNDLVVYGDSDESALKEAIKGEIAAIYSYEQLIKKLEMIKTDTGIICTQFINKLLADERHHLKLLVKEQNKILI